MAKSLSITEARNLARSRVLDSIQGTSFQAKPITFKYKGLATLEILTQDKSATSIRILDFFNSTDVRKVDENHTFTAVRSSNIDFKSFFDSIIIDIIPKISRVPILTVLLYSKRYNESLQKYLDKPNPLSNQIEKDLDTAFKYLFNSKTFTRLTLPFKDVLENLNGTSKHTGLQNTRRDISFNNNELYISSLNYVISDVTIFQPDKTRYISVKYSDGIGKRFFILSTSALKEYFYSNVSEVKKNIHNFFGLDGQQIGRISNDLSSAAVPILAKQNLELIIVNSLGKDIYLYHWIRFVGPNLTYIDRGGANVSISNLNYIYDEVDSKGLIRIVADSVTINNSTYKAEFEFRFSGNELSFNVFLTKK